MTAESSGGSHHRRDPHGMSRRSKYALVVMEEADRLAAQRGSQSVHVITSGSTGLYDGQAWIHWRTARALEQRGFVRITGDDEGPEVVWA